MNTHTKLALTAPAGVAVFVDGRRALARRNGL
jgi:hypothetical protein